MEKIWARVGRSKDGQWGVEITKGKSPLSDVIEFIPCGDEYAATKEKNRVMKELGLTYGGFQ